MCPPYDKHHEWSAANSVGPFRFRLTRRLTSRLFNLQVMREDDLKESRGYTMASPIINMPPRKQGFSGWGDDQPKSRYSMLSHSLPAQYTCSMPIAVPGGLGGGLGMGTSAAEDWTLTRPSSFRAREAREQLVENMGAVDEEDDFVPPHVMMSSSVQPYSHYSQSLQSSRAEDTTAMLRKDALRLRTAVLKSTGYLDDSAHTHHHLNPYTAPPAGLVDFPGSAAESPWPARALDTQLSAEKNHLLHDTRSPLMGAVPEMRAV